LDKQRYEGQLQTTLLVWLNKDGIYSTCRMKSEYKTLSENFKERDIFGDIGVDAKTKFKYFH